VLGGRGLGGLEFAPKGGLPHRGVLKAGERVKKSLLQYRSEGLTSRGGGRYLPWKKKGGISEKDLFSSLREKGAIFCLRKSLSHGGEYYQGIFRVSRYYRKKRSTLAFKKRCCDEGGRGGKEEGP